MFDCISPRIVEWKLPVTPVLSSIFGMADSVDNHHFRRRILVKFIESLQFLQWISLVLALNFACLGTEIRLCQH